jgi:hypothetical protein
MRRLLAVFVVCTPVYAGPVDCDDKICRVEKDHLTQMYQSRDQALRQRDDALEAYRAIRAQLNFLNCRAGA